MKTGTTAAADTESDWPAHIAAIRPATSRSIDGRFSASNVARIDWHLRRASLSLQMSVVSTDAAQP